MRFFAASMRLVLAGALCSLAIPASNVVARASTDEASAPQEAPCGVGLRPAGYGLCTHGGDRAPGPVQQAAFGAPAAAAASSTNGPCPGDGVSGPRIRVFYGYPSGTTPNTSSSTGSIRESVALADANLNAETPNAGGQHLRMFCKGGRRVTVTAIPLRPIGPDNFYDFDDVIDSLVDRVNNGLGASDIDTPRFTYAVFVDNVACCLGPIGQGTIYGDDRPDPDQNFNNRVGSGPRFAMIEFREDTVADAFVFLHEVGHTLGAVQISAPHSTGGFHCYTSVDVMCSFDGGWWFDQGGTMEDVCPQPPVGQFTFDCQEGDYYDIHPARGGYLSKHWNTADSAWLTNPR